MRVVTNAALYSIMSIAALSLVGNGDARNGTSEIAVAAAGRERPGPARPAVLDPAVIETTTGGKPEIAGEVIKVSFPRDDVKVEIDGWALPPFMGLTSWAAFMPAKKPGAEAMVMGDLVLFEDEVHGVMKTALDAGLEVTALHNHFFFDNPRVFFMHIGGEGRLAELGKGVRTTMDAARAVRANRHIPRDRSDAKPIPAQSSIEPREVEAVVGRPGVSKDGMVKVTVGRVATRADCGCQIGKAMGVNTWAAFAGTRENAVVDGDFAVTEDELQPVLRALTSSDIHVVAIHNHMVGEKPRILFLHYWGRGSVDSLGKSIRAALALTNVSE